MIVKRITDIAVAFLLILIFGPIMIIIAIIIKVTSSGSVLFRQQRVGYKQKPFIIHKFRTMKVSNAGYLITVDHDARITNIGKVLRSTKLDELPQLFDVLRGAMSLVGPRPEVPDYVQYYPLALTKIVFSVRPGITDLSSVLLMNEEEILGIHNDPQNFYIQQLLPIKIRMAVWYVKHRSFWLDIRLIYFTIANLFCKIYHRFFV